MPDPDRPIAGNGFGFRVRPAGGADAESLLPLIRSHAAFEGGEARITEAALRSALDQRPSRFMAWVATRAGAFVGYASATLDFSTWAGQPFLHLDCLFVEEGRRGGGIGMALLGTVRAHAAERKISEIQWQTPDWNEDAIRFYLREGALLLPKARFTLRTS